VEIAPFRFEYQLKKFVILLTSFFFIMKGPVILLGSTSPIKIGAISEVFPDNTVIGLNVPSGIPEQPVGKEQTLQGARNRAKNAITSATTDDWTMAIGIENGIWPEEDNGFWVDGAAIVIITRRDGDETIKWSDTIRVCDKQGCRQCCIVDPDTHQPLLPSTSRDDPHGFWAGVSDPHIVLTKKSRKDYIVDALKRLD
jgi:hypothetical protein